MKILFLTMSNFSSISEHSLYPDLIRYIASQGHEIVVLLPNEKRNGKETYIETIGKIQLVRVKTGNLFNVNMITKLISRAGVCPRYIKAIKKYLSNETIGLVLYSTPPTTFNIVVGYVKKVFMSKSYLMLKDIFPQNAVDLGMISQNGLIYKFLRIGEKKLYKSSDYIGCMSPANMDYLLRQDPWIDQHKVEVCPNALEKRERHFKDKNTIRKKYGLPLDRTIFIYGGGLGKPQGVNFLIECIKKYEGENAFFLICGDGAYLEPLQVLEKVKGHVMRVIKWLPVEEYDALVNSSDVGLIFLACHFKIPNYPSRLLLYLEAGLPILSATDKNSDIGKISCENGYGDWVESLDENIEEYLSKVDKFCDLRYREKMGEKAREYFSENYTVDKVYDVIFKHFE